MSILYYRKYSGQSGYTKRNRKRERKKKKKEGREGGAIKEAIKVGGRRKEGRVGETSACNNVGYNVGWCKGLHRDTRGRGGGGTRCTTCTRDIC